MTQLFAARDIPTADEVNSLMVNRYVKMTPTSVPASGTATINSAGDVDFHATVISINGIFNASFRSYDVYYDSVGTAATTRVNLRASGANNVTGYDLTSVLGSNNAISSVTTLNDTDWRIVTVAQTRHAAAFRIYAPFVAVETAVTGLNGAHANPAVVSTANSCRQFFGTHRTAASYDGLRFTFSATQVGRISVFGVY